MIVIGTHGRTGVDRLVMGSVAEGLMRNCRALSLSSSFRRAWPPPGVPRRESMILSIGMSNCRQGRVALCRQWR